MKLYLCLLCVLCGCAIRCFALDREAFTITKYDLEVRVEPGQQRLGSRGTVTLRNDSSVPQRIAVLQISSSLSWHSIKIAGKQVQFVAQPYTSDIDHTGALSEAIITLPGAVAPKGTVDLEIAYEGVILLDVTRLTRIGTPEEAANSFDWDHISPKFTAVRGAGNVAWYPIATEAADLSESASLFDVLHRWKMRETVASLHLRLTVVGDGDENKPELLINATNCPTARELIHDFVADCTYSSLGSLAPAFVIADYEVASRSPVDVHFLSGHDTAAATFADAAETASPLITDWFGALHKKAQTVDLPNADDAPFESGSLLLTPLSGMNARQAGLAAAHQLTHAAFSSPRPWINEGLAHFAQALYLERQSGRQAALDYMASHRSAINAEEKTTALSRTESDASGSLINTNDEELLRSKGMCVWWMLREMVGDAALKKAIAAYRPEQDKEPSYMQRLIQKQTQKDLEWFFDDWVYRDRGLPEFEIKSAFARKTLPEGYMLTVTVENLGAAGAQVPVTVEFAGGEVTQRLVIRGKSSTVTRVELVKPPEEIVVNDGSVPESNASRNTFKIESGDIRDSDSAK